MKKKKKCKEDNTFIAEDWARFKLKYKFPNNLVFPGINELNFDEIKNKVDKKKVVKKRLFSLSYLIEIN